MSRNTQRVIALSLAIIFFVTSVAIGLLVVWVSVTGNNGNDMVDQQFEQQMEQEDMLAGSELEGFTPVAAVDELEVIDTREGDGAEVQPGDAVTVDYTGAVAETGVIFQSSQDFGEPVSFALGNVIEGWTEGLPGMKEGGERRLIIPAEMAYGAEPPQGSNIPANAALVFDITLHDIGEPEAPQQ